MVNHKQIISQATPAYPYKVTKFSQKLKTVSSKIFFLLQAFFETFFSYTKEEKEGYLRDLEMCFDDSPMGNTVTSQLNHTDAPEIKLRNNIIKSKTLQGGGQDHQKVYFSIFLHVDFFQINKYLPLNVDLHLRLTRHSKSFGIIAPPAAAATEQNPEIPVPNYISYIHKLQLTTRAMLTSKE